MMRRRSLLIAGPALGLAGVAGALPPASLQFPRDHGSHPAFRTEWWYITGYARSGDREFGFQVTFFRSRVEGTQGMTSRFAARHVVFAHAAITDVKGGKLWHDQRIAREGFDIALAAQGDTRVRLRDWSLRHEGDTYLARIPGTDFSLDLRCTRTQPLLLQGIQGLSRKGPDPEQASYYYSVPQLSVAGVLSLKGTRFEVTAGTAWLDHEWSEELLHPQAVGWDWIGMNLDDGSALTAFRLRRQDGSSLWDGGSFRSATGQLTVFNSGEVVFTAQRRWTSAVSQATYPVDWTVRTPSGSYAVKAVVDNQELDSRSSTGAIYWEGLSNLLDGTGRQVGRGYLEMTGYSQRLRL
jgi:predicted secreted hydrolase